MSGRVLLLQGPMGPFFRRLAEELRAEGHQVFKINFNGGDAVFYPDASAVPYTGSLGEWPRFFTHFVRKHRIDRVFLFGDCRPYHVAAAAIARLEGVAVFVFEEGYLRPDYITIEPGGVNGKSELPQDPEVYQLQPGQAPEQLRLPGGTFLRMAWFAVVYVVASWLWRWRFPHYRHHRTLNPFVEALRWTMAGGKKLYRRFADRPLYKRLCLTQRGKFFLVPLQVHSDAQVTHYSRFEAVEEFIEEVVRSFAERAPTDTWLVLKHHPLDRAYRNYRPFIRSLAQRYGLDRRLFYLHEAWLPNLLRYARGVVTINSTVGLSAIHHGTPVKALGIAIYDMPGLTSQRALDDFWSAPGEVDYPLYQRFRQYLITHVLGVGSFYRRLNSGAGATGIVWPLGSISAASDPDRAAVLPTALPGAVASANSPSAMVPERLS
jgi:capsule polysaccharide modification protein KpsS